MPPKTLRYQRAAQKADLFVTDPELALYEEMQQMNENLASVLEELKKKSRAESVIEIDGSELVGPKGEDGKHGVSPDMGSIVESVVTTLKSPEHTQSVVEQILKHPILRVLLHGGGGSSSSSGTTLTPRVPTGTINGVNKTFTTTGAINALFADGLFMILTTDYTYSGGTITMVIAPTSAIYAI